MCVACRLNSSHTTLQRAATRCNTLQHTSAQCNTQQQFQFVVLMVETWHGVQAELEPHCITTQCNPAQPIAPHCNTLPHLQMLILIAAT